MGSLERRCLTCRRLTTEALCPNDGMVTLLVGAPTRHPSDVPIGEVVAGRYRIEGLLGGGGFATVFAARHVSTGQEVAVKVLASDADDRALLRFFQEARVTAALKHPNTVRVFDVGQDDSGLVYLTMERIRGPSLLAELAERRAAGRPFTEREILELAIPIARSLTEAHEAGLVHRDLKPANVMLEPIVGEAPLVKVLDFGIAKLRGVALTGTAQSPLTPEYASPEQARGDEVDHQSDLYSLGVLLFELATFAVPFRGANPFATLYMHVERPPPELGERAKCPVSPAFVELVERLLAKSKDERPATAAVLREQLEAVRDGRPLTLPALEQTRVSARTFERRIAGADDATRDRGYSSAGGTESTLDGETTASGGGHPGETTRSLEPPVGGGGEEPSEPTSVPTLPTRPSPRRPSPPPARRPWLLAVALGGLVALGYLGASALRRPARPEHPAPSPAEAPAPPAIVTEAAARPEPPVPASPPAPASPSTPVAKDPAPSKDRRLPPRPRPRPKPSALDVEL